MFQFKISCDVLELLPHYAPGAQGLDDNFSPPFSEELLDYHFDPTIMDVEVGDTLVSLDLRSLEPLYHAFQILNNTYY